MGTIIAVVTLPGLIALTSGAALLTWRKVPDRRAPGIAGKMAATGGHDAAEFLSLHMREDVFGSLNLLVCLVVLNLTARAWFGKPPARPDVPRASS